MVGDRVTRRSPAARAAAEKAPRSARFAVGEERFVVVSFALPSPAPVAPGGLTAAERAVLALVLAGLDNRTIGERRGTSMRTVANQLASIFRKHRVSSRQELAARLPSLEHE